jgi:hypothetical protein
LTDIYPLDWDCNPNGGLIGLGLYSEQEDVFIKQVLNDYPQEALALAPNK